MRTSICSKFLIAVVLLSTSILYASGDLVYSTNGMVVSESSLASEVGVEIMRKGGNAVDAAVAVGFALAVTFPGAGNIGGGGFLVLHLNDKNTTIDFREKAPLASTETMFLNEEGNYDPDKSLKEWTSIGVPGTVAGLLFALEKYGTLSREEVIQPAIELARNGFELDYWTANSINEYNSEFAAIESSKKIFTDKGDSLKMGKLFVQKDLASTLELIKENGIDGFYDGKVAQMFVTQSTSNGGIITYEDLLNYKPVEREPIVSKYKEYTHIGMPPPSAGGIGIAQALRVLECFNFTQVDWGSSEYVHTITEILKFVYSDRAAYLGDSDFIDIPINYLLSDEHIEAIFQNIDQRATPSVEINQMNNLQTEGNETTHYSVIDRDGNAVAVTYTLNSAYGNKIVLEGAGFLLNNEMDDFTAKLGVKNQFGLVGSSANKIVPEKRMLSSISPTIILKDNEPLLILGSPGGSKIITSVLQVILNVVEFDMNIRDAISAPRFHHQWLPDEIKYEKFGLSEDVRINLVEKGHKLTEVEILGIVNGILVDGKNKLIWGCSDKRGNGKAIGY